MNKYTKFECVENLLLELEMINTGLGWLRFDSSILAFHSAIIVRGLASCSFISYSHKLLKLYNREFSTSSAFLGIYQQFH